MDLQDTFISNLKRFRKEQNMTQEKLAELCKTDTSHTSGRLKQRNVFLLFRLLKESPPHLKLSLTDFICRKTQAMILFLWKN